MSSLLHQGCFSSVYGAGAAQRGSGSLNPPVGQTQRQQQQHGLGWHLFASAEAVSANSLMPALPSRYGNQSTLEIKNSLWFKLGAVHWIWWLPVQLVTSVGGGMKSPQHSCAWRSCTRAVIRMELLEIDREVLQTGALSLLSESRKWN